MEPLRPDPVVAPSPLGSDTMNPVVTDPVVVVDDEPMVREVVCTYLAAAGLPVIDFGDGAEALAWLDERRASLVVLDVMLPGADGITILRRLRDGGDVPVILLTARSEEDDRVSALELGADDYLVKPFSARELTVRARNLLRRAAGGSASEPSRLDHGRLVIDLTTREVYIDGAAALLTPKEFDLLVVLARSPRKVFSRRELLDLVWNSTPEFQDPATVTVHVGRLRQKLEPDPTAPRWLQTAWGVGYRFEP